MENKLKKLFDYQKFEQNERLAKLIAETEARQAETLSDDALAFVAAAGDRRSPDENNKAHDGGGVYNGWL